MRIAPSGILKLRRTARGRRSLRWGILRDMQAHQTANRSYIEEGIQLLELAHNAYVLFESQPATEKRKLLDFVLSNCTWKGGELTTKYRQPFDVLAVAVASEQQRMGKEMAETARNDIWLPERNPYPEISQRVVPDFVLTDRDERCSGMENRDL